MKSLNQTWGASSSSALDLELVKTDLRISGNELDNALSSQYIPAAVAWAEGQTWRSLISRSIAWCVDAFPGQAENYTFRLPGGVVSAVAGIAYVSDGQTITLTGPDASPAGTDFQQDLSGHVARILPPQGEGWPAADTDAIRPVVVTYTAGWASDKLVPADLRRAMVAHIFGAMELDGLLDRRPGFDADFAEKQISAYRAPV